jgi:hypothetical protein
LTNNQKYAILITESEREVTKMEMMIYVNGYPMSGAISGCEYIGEAWLKAQALAELLGVSCALVSAETGEVIAWWEP